MNLTQPIKLYRPSNGTEGEIFMQNWCCHCARDKGMSEGLDFDDCDDDKKCQLIGNSMAFDLHEEGYPKEWCYDHNGQPQCTAFVPNGQPIPFKDELTLDLFNHA